MPWKPSVSGGLPAPMPSEKRPPESRCRPAAASAIVAGVRPHAEITDVPRPIRDVRRASSASTIVESCVHPSATSTRSRPALVGPHAQPQDDVGARLERGERHADAHATTISAPRRRVKAPGVGVAR